MEEGFERMLEEDGGVDDVGIATEGKERMEDWLQESLMDEKQI